MKKGKKGTFKGIDFVKEIKECGRKEPMSYLEEFDINSPDLIREAQKNIFVVDSSVVFKWFFSEHEGNLEIVKHL